MAESERGHPALNLSSAGQAYAVVSEVPKTFANKKGAADERANKTCGSQLPSSSNL